MTSADFDGDGRPDIALADDNSSSVTVITRVASNVPAESHTYSVGIHPVSIAAGDFNGDGKQDIATANNTSYDVTLLLNDGTGGFIPAGNFFVGSGTQAIAAGDFNGDGRSDVAVGTGPGGKTVVLLGKSQGGFGTPIDQPPAAKVIVTGDINNDGKLDLAVITGSIEIWLGDGTGHFPIVSCGGGPATGIALGDVDGDGKLDLVAAFVLQSQIQVMRGDGAGCFGPPVVLDGRFRQVKLEDLNKDGRPELIADTTVRINDGSGGFGPPRAYGTSSGGTEAGSNTASVNDFDLDGNLDVATVGRGSVSILLGDGFGGFKFALGGSASGIGRGDFNADGKVDLAVSHGNVTIMLGNGMGAFASPQVLAMPSSSSYVGPVIADFNGDSKLDLATLDSTANGPGGKPRLHALLGDGLGGFGPVISTSFDANGPAGLAGGDLNGDGKSDLITLNRAGGINNGGSISILLSDGVGHFGAPTSFSVRSASSPKQVGVADFNNDHKLDLAVPSGYGFAILLGDGSGGFAAPIDYTSANASSIAVSEFNGDGKPDLVLVSSENASVVFGDGSGGFGAPLSLGLAAYALDATTADFNGDGSNDIAVTREDSSSGLTLGSVSVLFGDGRGAFGPAARFVTDTTPGFIIAGDFNGDRRPDIVTANTVGNISLLINTCTGPVGPPPVVEFSAPTYTRGEGEPNAIITVTRTGDTSGLSTVSYTTNDAAGTSNCNITDGYASSRCDYLTAMGSLRFAANETSKTISVPIVNDSYAEGISESFGIGLNNPSGATLGATSSATIIITDDDSANGVNPIDTASFSVRQHYVDFLNREADTSGLNFWIGEIESCTPKPQCTELKRINVSAAFFLSIEFQETGYLVYRMYKASYGNIPGTPVPVRLNEFLPDTQQIGQGVVVGVGNWQTQLENNKVAFALDFVTRTRFTAAYPTTMTPPQFVDALFTNAGVTPSPTDRDAAVNEFGVAANTADTAARGRALRRVAENSILNQQETNKAFVLMQYFGYLRRNPNDAPEQNLNFDGYNFWLGKLNQFNGNFVNAEMVKAFLVSGEYRQRFGP